MTTPRSGASHRIVDIQCLGLLPIGPTSRFNGLHRRGRCKSASPPQAQGLERDFA